MPFTFIKVAAGRNYSKYEFEDTTEVTIEEAVYSDSPLRIGRCMLHGRE